MFHLRHPARRFMRDLHAHRHGSEDEHGERRHERGGRASLGRFFAHGDLRLLILHLIAEQPRHGYEIIKEIEERVAGAYTPSPGVIYPTLTLLEELGHVTVTPGEGAKKLHTITPEGQAMLDANRPARDAILARIAEAGQDGATTPPIMRAMHNLKRALRHRMTRGDLHRSNAQVIADALDAAAASIERS